MAKKREFITMADIYREARELWQVQDFKFGDGRSWAPDHTCLTHAVNVARWMPAIPELTATKYGTVKLEWHTQVGYLSMEFFTNHINILKVFNKAHNIAQDQTQHFDTAVPIDSLFMALFQFSVEIQNPIKNEPKPWDSFEGVAIPDLDMAAIEQQEEEVLAAMEAEKQKLTEEEAVAKTTENSTIEEIPEETTDVHQGAIIIEDQADIAPEK